MLTSTGSSPTIAVVIQRPGTRRECGALNLARLGRWHLSEEAPLHDRWFDEFATAVSSTASRRQLLRTFAAGALASLFGRSPAFGAAAVPVLAQPTDEPLPNFPFLIALPTDPGLEQYKLDVDLTGPPTRIQSLSAFPDRKS